MPIEKRGIDHVIVMARDMDRCVENYRRLGFTITPRMYHPFGTANNLIMFQDSFLEILGVARPAELHGIGKMLSDLLEQKEGVSHFALLSTDAAADREEFLRKGLQPSPVTGFERPVDLPDGTKTKAVVSVCTLDNKDTPRVMMFVCQQHVASAIWVPQWQRHVNGAVDISRLVIVSDHPRQQFAHLLTQLFGAEKVDVEDECVSAQAAAGQRIEAMTPARYVRCFPGVKIEFEPVVPYIAAVTIDVEDLQRLAACAAQNGVRPLPLPGGSLWVGPEHANGIALEFREP